MMCTTYRCGAKQLLVQVVVLLRKTAKIEKTRWGLLEPVRLRCQTQIAALFTACSLKVHLRQMPDPSCHVACAN